MMNSWKLFMNFRRMRNIKRCNNFPVIDRTDVAQHSYFTTMLAMLFSDECSKVSGCKPINNEVLLRKCLLHDIEESFTSDIPYPIKHSSKEFHSTLDGVINTKTKELFLSHSTDNGVWMDWNEIRCSCKADIEGNIVSFCDMLELSLYCYEELSMGNKSILRLLDNCNNYLDELLNRALYQLFGSEYESLGAHGIVPSIYELRNLVLKDEKSGKYIVKEYMLDLP